MPRYPVNPGDDAKAVWDGLSFVTVTRRDPDTGDELEVCDSVTLLQSVVTDSQVGVGDGTMEFDHRSFWLLASDLTFVPKTRDQLTDDEDTVWVIGQVVNEAFDTIYSCRDCTKSRS